MNQLGSWMHIFCPLFFLHFYNVFIKAWIPCCGSTTPTNNTNCRCGILAAELPLFSPKLTPLSPFSLSPHHAGLEQWACHEILQKLSPCSCRSDSVVETLLWSDLCLVSKGLAMDELNQKLLAATGGESLFSSVLGPLYAPLQTPVWTTHSSPPRLSLHQL